MYRAPRSFLAWRGAGVLVIAIVGLGFAAFASDKAPVLRAFMGAAGLAVLWLAARCAHDWVVSWGFTADEAGLALTRGRQEVRVSWSEIDRVDTRRFSARLHLRHPERTVVVPHPPATNRPGEWTGAWARVGDGWRIVEPGTAPSAGPIDGDWLRGVSLGTAPRGYAIEPVTDLLARCADTIDALSSPGGPPATVQLVTPQDIEQFEVAIARNGADPEQVDELLERIEVRLTELHARRGGQEPG